MKKFFVVSDVHSFYTEMITALNEVGFDINNDTHIFVSCGDLLDRGPDAQKCLDFVNGIPDDRKILIKGNHEELLEDVIHRGYFLSHDFHNRTHETVYQLTGIHPTDNSFSSYAVDRTAISDMLINKSWDEYKSKLIDFYETDKYIFVHGWIPYLLRYEEDKDDQSIIHLNTIPYYNEEWRKDSADWDGARWANGMYMWSCGIKEENKTIVCGHWHSSYGHSVLHNDGVEFSENTGSIYSKHTPFYDDGIIAIDACTAYSGFVNCIVLDVEDN